MPDEVFPAARELAANTWGQLLSRLERVGSCPGGRDGEVSSFDPALRVVAWFSPRDPGLRAHDLATGRLVFESRALPCLGVEIRSDRLFAGADGRLVAIDLATGAAEERTVEGLLRLLEASPEGERVLLDEGTAARVRRWPGLETLREVPIDGAASVGITDWPSGWLAVRSFDRGRFEAWPLQGGSPPRVLEAPDLRAHLCGRGLALQTRGGPTTVHSLARGWALPLRGASHVSPSPDGRALRVVRERRPLRLETDLETGTLRSEWPAHPPGDVGGRHPEWAEPWHPHADLVLLEGDPDRFALRDLAGEAVATFRGATPVAWSEGGHRLVLRVVATAELEVRETPRDPV